MCISSLVVFLHYSAEGGDVCAMPQNLRFNSVGKLDLVRPMFKSQSQAKKP